MELDKKNRKLKNEINDYEDKIREVDNKYKKNISIQEQIKIQNQNKAIKSQLLKSVNTENYISPLKSSVLLRKSQMKNSLMNSQFQNNVNNNKIQKTQLQDSIKIDNNNNINNKNDKSIEQIIGSNLVQSTLIENNSENNSNIISSLRGINNNYVSDIEDQEDLIISDLEQFYKKFVIRDYQGNGFERYKKDILPTDNEKEEQYKINVLDKINNKLNNFGFSNIKEENNMTEHSLNDLNQYIHEHENKCKSDIKNYSNIYKDDLYEVINTDVKDSEEIVIKIKNFNKEIDKILNNESDYEYSNSEI
jgi:hypothetical protein